MRDTVREVSEEEVVRVGVATRDGVGGGQRLDTRVRNFRGAAFGNVQVVNVDFVGSDLVEEFRHEQMPQVPRELLVKGLVDALEVISE